MSDTKNSTAKIKTINRLSPIWIIPIVTALIGVWIIFSYVSNQGRSFTLFIDNADGLVAGKTSIKNRSVDVGVIEKVTLSNDFKQVIATGRMKKNMDTLLKEDTVFWVVKPQVGRKGISGLGTIFSGAYIEVMPGTKAEIKEARYTLHEQEPISSPNMKGIRVNLVSDQSGVLSVGAPILFRGVSVGKLEQARFDPISRLVFYEAFIPSPYDMLVTDNIRFWLDNGIDLELSPQGMHLGIPSIDALFGGGISFDIPDGAGLGEQVKDYHQYKLYDNKARIHDSQYTDYKEFLLFFSDSIGGLTEGAPVEFRGIRLGTVSQAPFMSMELNDLAEINYNVPVLIKIEMGRLKKIGKNGSAVLEKLISEQNKGLRAALKSANLLTGALYIDLNFYNDEPTKNIQDEMYGYPTIATVSTGLNQIQSKIIETLDNINKLPVDAVLVDLRKTLQESQQSVALLNKMLASKEVQQLPKDTQAAIRSLNATLKNLQPGSVMHKSLLNDMQRMEEVLKELKPVLKTLNEKSNSLVFEAKSGKDPEPKAKKSKDK